MDRGDGVDVRLLQAYELLQSLITNNPVTPQNPSSHWQIDLVPPPDSQGIVSATDLLGWWFRAPTNSPNPWDSYFGGVSTSVLPAYPPQTVSATQQPTPDSPGAQTHAAPINPVTQHNMRRFFSNPEDHIHDADAEAVIDCLYRFIHALAVCNVEAAMEDVAESYHVIDNDREIDKLGLRQQCESLLDSFHGWDIKISLAEVPEPIPYQSSVLVDAKIQIDAHQPELDKRRSVVKRRIAVFNKSKEDIWQIVALSQPQNEAIDATITHQ